MNNKYNINLFQQQKLFKLLNSFKKEQNSRLRKANTNNNNNDNNSNIDTNPSLLDIHDISISIIFTFLNKKDHISCQKSCKSLTIIGRKRESFRIKIDDHSYIDFGGYLFIEHKLPQIISDFQSDNDKDMEKGINALNALCFLADQQVINKIAHSGIVSLLFEKCANYNTNICEKIGQCIYNMLFICSNAKLFLKYGILKFSKQLLLKGFITLCFNIIICLIHYDKTCAISLNRMKLFPLLVKKFFCELQGDAEYQFENRLNIIDIMISSISFDWDCIDNKIILVQIRDNLLLLMTQQLMNCDLSFYRKWTTEDNSILNIAKCMRNNGYFIKFINCGIYYDNNAIQAIRFLIKCTKINNLWVIINKWLDIEIHILLDAEICEFVLNNCDTTQCFNIYLKLLSNLDKSIKSKQCLQRVRKHLFANDYVPNSFGNITLTNWRIDLIDELCHFLLQLNNILPITAWEAFHRLTTNHEFIHFIQQTLRKSNDNFMQMLQIIYRMLTNGGQPLDYLRLHWAVFCFIMDERHKIYIQIIELCYCVSNTIPIECCLALDTKPFCNKLNDVLIENGVVYAYQHFLCQHAPDTETKCSKLHFAVSSKINSYVSHFGELICKRISSHNTMEQIILGNIVYNDYTALIALRMLGSKANNILFRVDKHKICNKIIKSCYSTNDIAAMQCCLQISNICDKKDRMTLIEQGIIYAFQDFIVHFKDKLKHSDFLLSQVMNVLNDYVIDYGGFVTKQLTLGNKLKENILNSQLYSQHEKKTARKCDKIWVIPNPVVNDLQMFG